MKVLVIGGNQFFGLNIVNLLIERGLNVHVMNRGNHTPTYQGNINHIKADREDIVQFKKVAKNNWDYVFDNYCMNESHAQTSVDFFKDDCGKYVFTSTQCVYEAGENLSERNFLDGNYKISESFLTTHPYHENKRRADKTFQSQSKFEVLTVRPSLVLGPRDHTQRLFWHIDKNLKKERMFFPSLNSKVSLVHAEDLAQATVNLALNGKVGPYNVTSPSPVSLKRFNNIIEETTKVKSLFSEELEDNHSPYGIENDWWMNTDSLAESGIRVPEIESWLPKLIQQAL